MIGRTYLVLFLVAPAIAAAADVRINRPLAPTMVGVGGSIKFLSTDGKVTREHKVGGNIHDAWLLPNGHVLFANGKGATEIDDAGKVVWQYVPEFQKGGSVYACQRLPDGRTLVGENSTGRVLEVDASGKVVFELKLPESLVNRGTHQNTRMVRKLANGNYLVCHSGKKLVREYTPKGKVVWEASAGGKVAFSAVRLANGNTLVANVATVQEFDKAGKVVWKVEPADLGTDAIQNMTCLQVLPGGNIVIGCYRAFWGEKGGPAKGSLIAEVTRDKKLVWRWTDRTLGGSCMAVQVLGKDGKPGKARPLR